MRPDLKVKVARRKHTIDVLRWVYARRDATLDGARLSLDHRHRQEGGVAETKPLTYGEVDVPDFLSILDITKPRQGEVFVDLGSGTGKAVLASACGFPEFSKCLGIEIVQGLSDAAKDHLRTAQALLSGPPSAPDVHGILTNANGNKSDRSTPPSGGTSVTDSVAGTIRRPGEQTNRASRGAGGSGKAGRKGSRSNKSADRGLSAEELEELVVDLLTRTVSPWGGVADGGSGETIEVTAEDIASRLVKELGHRRYKASLRGYGGLQKFLVARKESQSSFHLEIATGGVSVALKRTAAERLSDVEVGASVCDRETGHLIGVGEGESNRHAPECCRGCNCVCRNGVSGSCVNGWTGNFGEIPSSISTLEETALAGEGHQVAHNHDPTPALATDATLLQITPSPFCDAPCAVEAGMSAESYGRECGGGGRVEGGGGRVFSDRRRMPAAGPLTCESLRCVELVNGDIFMESWDDAGVVYVASLLFDDRMMGRLSECVERLQKGARIISLRPIVPRPIGTLTALAAEGNGSCSQEDSKAKESTGSELPWPVLRLVHEGVFKMSWQMARVYIYLRL